MFGRKKAPTPSAPPPPPPPAPTPAQAATALRRENDRTARSAGRAMDGELRRLRAEETKLKNEMKSLARAGKVNEAKILSKNLVQNRKFQEKCFASKYQVQSIANQGGMAIAQQKVAGAMGDAVGIMGKVNAMNDPAGMVAVAQQFEMESGKAEVNQEMMDDALEGAFGGAEVDTETDNILNEVLAEAGMEVGGRLDAAGATPSFVPSAKARDEAAAAREHEEIERRLAALGAPPGTGF
jgi:division protein CdvB (Snf7/Vps24/ESCRT-III family)